MSSYFVAAAPGGDVAVHDRNRCPPAAFREGAGTEYLGEFFDAAQAIAVARLRYAHARGCPCCGATIRSDAPLVPGARHASAHRLNPS